MEIMENTTPVRGGIGNLSELSNIFVILPDRAGFLGEREMRERR